jgi:ABC-2 type transport system ATP-binding protein
MKDKRTIIITTNYMEEADYLCDRVAILDHGRLIALGSPDELKRSHLGEVVELALKDAPQSFLDNLAQVFAGITENFITEELTERGAGWVKVSLRVPDASSKVAKIIEAARNHGVETSEVNVRAPSLNDVFIELTGKRLRE